MQLFIDPKIKKCFLPDFDIFDQIMHLRGKVFRELENRRTQRVAIDNGYYFVKQHFGIGWKEIFKNLLQFRLPVFGAKNEWQAINLLKKLRIHTLTTAGYGQRGWNPAHIQSFLITEELPPNISLEDLCKDWATEKPAYDFKFRVLRQVAFIAREMHQHGINHRDFYLCHFLLDIKNAFTTQQKDRCKLYLIDLHRAQIRKKIPERWVIKDLAGLYFSSKDIGLTARDLLRFMKEYRNKPLREILNTEMAFWQKVKQRGDKLYQQHGN